MTFAHLQKVYDYVLTFELENHYIWSKQPWSLIRVLFFVNRYMPFVDVTLSLCSECYCSLPTYKLIYISPIAQLVPSMSDRGCTLMYEFNNCESRNPYSYAMITLPSLGISCIGIALSEGTLGTACMSLGGTDSVRTK